MSLEMQQREILDEVIENPHLYRSMLNKWERLGLSVQEFNLAIGNSSKTEYSRDKGLSEYKTIVVSESDNESATASQLLSAVNSIINELGENAIINYSNDHYDDETDQDYYGFCLQYCSEIDESDESFSRRVGLSMSKKKSDIELLEARKKRQKAKLDKKRQSIIANLKDTIDAVTIGDKIISRDELIEALKNTEVK